MKIGCYWVGGDPLPLWFPAPPISPPSLITIVSRIPVKSISAVPLKTPLRPKNQSIYSMRMRNLGFYKSSKLKYIRIDWSIYNDCLKLICESFIKIEFFNHQTLNNSTKLPLSSSKINPFSLNQTWFKASLQLGRSLGFFCSKAIIKLTACSET